MSPRNKAWTSSVHQKLPPVDNVHRNIYVLQVSLYQTNAKKEKLSAALFL
jgi:hypothetical protein